MTEPRQTIIDTPAGVRLAVHDWGGDGPPVLLAHPTGFHGRIWAPVVAALHAATGARCYSFDFRGHGDSDVPDPDVESPEIDAYDWHHFADDVLAVTRHLGLEGRTDAIFAGHSKGAASILLGEVARPGTYTNVWAFEPILFPAGEVLPPNDDFPLAVGARKRRNEWSSTDEAYESYASKPPLNVMRSDSLHAYVDHALCDRGDGTLVLKCPPTVEARVYTMGPNNGLFADLPHIASTVKVCCGEHSDAISPRLAEAIVERLPNATLEVWDGHGHFGPQADPDRAARSILAARAPTAS